MKIGVSRLSALAVLLLGSAVVALADGPDTFVRHQATIRVRPGGDLARYFDMCGDSIVAVRDAIPSRGIYLLSLSVDDDEQEFENDSEDYEEQDPHEPHDEHPLAWVELNYQGRASEGQTGSIYFNILPTFAAQYQSQYVVSQLGLGVAHLLAIGTGTRVALIDTGIDVGHEALVGHIAPGGRNFLNDSDDVRDIGDGIDNDGDELVDEMVGHGTFLAGLIALTAPNAQILPIVALDSDGEGDSFKVAKAIFYAIDNGASVINLSLGSTYDSRAVSDAIAEARSRGVVVVAAAGNLNRSTPAEYPAMGGRALGVAAVGPSDIRASFSNFSSLLSLSAPGDSGAASADPNALDPMVSIVSCIPGGDESQYAVWSGTSLSAAFVAGAAALIRGQHPDWPPCEQTAIAIERILKDSAIDIDPLNPGYEGMLGAGRIDVSGALVMALAASTPGDFDHNGQVDLTDLATLLGAYGRPSDCVDLTGDGYVGLEDVAVLLSNFGG